VETEGLRSGGTVTRTWSTHEVRLHSVFHLLSVISLLSYLLYNHNPIVAPAREFRNVMYPRITHAKGSDYRLSR
jgi:hypothetical protein